MGHKSKNSTFEQRQLVVFHHAKGLTHRDIVKILNMKRSTVSDIIRRFEREDRIESVPQKGQPKKLTERDIHSVMRKARKRI